MKKIPAIAVTIGDPAGIGAEIAVKAFFGDYSYTVKPILICDSTVLLAAADICGITCDSPVVSSLSELETCLMNNQDSLPVIYNCSAVDDNAVCYGEVHAHYGKAAYTYIETAVNLINKGYASAVVTGPINKESLQAAGVPYIGHTEILGGLTNVANPLTMFETLGMRVFFLSRHVSLRKACDLVTEKSVYEHIDKCSKALQILGDTSGKPLAVAGLNPHSGEHGLFGDEEETAVRPAVERASADGYSVAGPIGADSVFHQAKIGIYSAVLSLYHDQGHIAAKTLDFERTVSVTLELPFLRTSVDHGTAFDIAGTGAASEISMVEAFQIAEKYAPFYARK
ncbi:MAG: 4-hydroxythreonine-4-phosphate dehydrogenase PdxA [Bacteroidetes bacterium]|nr:4-hydroxythreonine-4-phosphate dehydrogenase PdxA [Bacteroidota bacterium]